MRADRRWAVLLAVGHGRPERRVPHPVCVLDRPNQLDRAMQSGEVARLDIGCAVSGYMGDVGRTVPVSGKFTAEQAEVVDLLAAAYRAGLAVIRDGTPLSDVKRASVAEVERRKPSLRTPLGRAAAAMITRPDGVPYWQIHGVGLDVAEPYPIRFVPAWCWTTNRSSPSTDKGSIWRT